MLSIFKGFKDKFKERIRSSLLKLLLSILLIAGLAIVIFGAFELKGTALLAVMILGGFLIAFAIISMTVASIGKTAIAIKDYKRLREMLEEKDQAYRELELKHQESTVQPLKIKDIQPILDMGILEVDFELTKYFDQQYKGDYSTKDINTFKRVLPSSKERGDLRFIGGLRAKFRARYGFDLLTMKVKEDTTYKKFYVSGVDPVFKGTTDFPQLAWEGSIMLGFSIANQRWQCNPEFDKIESDLKEELRKSLQNRLKTGPEELNFIKNPLQEHIRRLIQGLFAPKGYAVVLVDEKIAKGYIHFTKFLSDQSIVGFENLSGTEDVKLEVGDGA